MDPSATISLEHPDEANHREIMTVARLFTERLDLFGKPSQKFYEVRAFFAPQPPPLLSLSRSLFPLCLCGHVRGARGAGHRTVRH